MPALESAALLNGRYHVLRPVGRGGMGAVYEAIDLRLRNTVAVKQMTATGDEARQAFEREARLLGALRHAALLYFSVAERIAGSVAFVTLEPAARDGVQFPRFPVVLRNR